MKDTFESLFAKAFVAAVLEMMSALAVAQGSAPVLLNRAKAAVDLVRTTYEPAPVFKDSDTPIPGDGAWSVRKMHEGETVKACLAAETTCYVVIYRAGNPVVTCEWTVAFGKEPTVPGVVAQSATTSAKMLRVFGEKASKGQLDSCFRDVKIVISDAGGPDWPSGKPPVDGVVKALLVVDAKGRVIAVKAVSGPEKMRSPIADNMRLWQMEPCVVNEVAIPFAITLTVDTTVFGPVNTNYSNNH